MDAGQIDAAEELRAAQRFGWYVGIPLYDVRRKRWRLYAFDTTENAPTGRRSRECTTVGTSEEECVLEMARCLRKVSGRRGPKLP